MRGTTDRARALVPGVLDVPTVAASVTVYHRGARTRLRATGATAGCTLVLDDCLRTFAGAVVEIENAASESVTVENAGATLSELVLAGTSLRLVCLAAADADGEWAAVNPA